MHSISTKIDIPAAEYNILLGVILDRVGSANVRDRAETLAIFGELLKAAREVSRNRGRADWQAAAFSLCNRAMVVFSATLDLGAERPVLEVARRMFDALIDEAKGGSVTLEDFDAHVNWLAEHPGRSNDTLIVGSLPLVRAQSPSGTA